MLKTCVNNIDEELNEEHLKHIKSVCIKFFFFLLLKILLQFNN